MQTLFLYASTLETNNDFTRILCDQWLEILFDDAETAQSAISSVLLLRNARDLLLQLTLQSRKEKAKKIVRFSKILCRFLDLNKSLDIETVSKPQTYELQRLLSTKMSEFLERPCLYAIRRVLPGGIFLERSERNFSVRFCFPAELDTIYRQNEDETIGTKINDYLSYNRFVLRRCSI